MLIQKGNESIEFCDSNTRKGVCALAKCFTFVNFLTMLRCFQGFVILIWFVECAGFRLIGQRFPLQRIPNSVINKAPNKLHFFLGLDFDMPTLVANFVGPALEATEQVDLNGIATEPVFFQDLFSDARDLAFLVAGVAVLSILPGGQEEDNIVDAANADRMSNAKCPQCQGSGSFFDAQCDVCSGTGKIDYNNPSFQLPGATRHARVSDRRVIIDNDDNDEDDDGFEPKGWFGGLFDDDDDEDEDDDVCPKSKKSVALTEYSEDEDQETEVDNSNSQQIKKRQSRWFDNDEI